MTLRAVAGASAGHRLAACLVSSLLRAGRFSAVALVLAALAGCGSGGDAVVSIALHPKKPDIFYVATNQAVFKTRDGGSSWERFPSFSARRVTTLAVDPKLSATVYAGTMGDAVYKSPDGGQRWLPHNVGLKEHVSYVNQFVFHPDRNETIYAATTVGVFRTTDGARTWEEQMAGMKEVHIVVALAINPQDPQILYAGTTGGAYRSLDGTGSWQKVNNGLIPPEILEASLSLGINVLEVDPAQPDRVYAGATKGLFKTENRGDLWTRIGTTLPDQFISTLAIDPTVPSTLYVGGRAGLFKTTDAGETWHAMNEGLETLNVRTVVISPRDPQLLYLGTNGSGLYRSRDGGRTWTPLPLTLRSGTSASA